MSKVLKVILRALAGGLLGAVLGIIPGLATWVILTWMLQANHRDWEIGILVFSVLGACIVVILSAITGLVIAGARALKQS
ncbi:MAG: hypothetical protein FJZ89_01835 [Chloroflexi bacterium]|nr:hypothetical protein [Chloroflexota bacterium]